MEDQDKSPNIPTTPTSVGDQLRAAREALGLSREDISTQTRVAERHLLSIEENRFRDLAAPTYAVGFARAYARAVGLDQADIAQRVRREIDAQPQSRPAPLPSFEPGDPARVPPSRIAWLAGLAAVVVVGLLLVYWNDFLSPEGELPDLVANASQGAATPVAPPPNRVAPPPTAAASGPVVLTALGPKVWVKITDRTGAQVFQKELALNEAYTVPAEAQEPQLRTARPDQLRITVGGQPIAPLGDKPAVISGVLLTPAALRDRSRGTDAIPASGPSQPSPASAGGAPAAQGNPLSTTQP